MTPECESCQRLLTRMTERMIHTERIKNDLCLTEKNLDKLSIKCASLQFENECLEEKVKKLEERIEERERLLEVINKDRDECLQEKMKVARFYRSELKKVVKENEELKKQYSSVEVGEDPLEDLISAIRQDRERNSKFLSHLEKTGRQMESIIEKVSDLEVAMKEPKRLPLFSGSYNQMRLLFDTESGVGQMEDPIRCSCSKIHETLDDMFQCAEKNGSASREDSMIVERQYDVDADDEADDSIFGS